MPNNTIVKTDAGRHYVDWPAILAGVAVSLGISTVFLTFGSSLGLSFASFQAPTSTPVAGVLAAAALWFVWVQVSSFMGGAYMTGRLRRKVEDATVEEAELRDGAHGLIVWAVNLTIGIFVAGFLALAGISGTLAVATSVATSPSAPNAESLDYAVDRMLRGAPAPGLATTAEGTPPEANEMAVPSAATADERAQFARILSRGIAGRPMDEADTTYLARQIAARTQIPEEEARQRLNEAVTALKARAEDARRMGVILGFLTAASFLISGAASWWAARTAGKHRDESVDHSRFVRWT